MSRSSSSNERSSSSSSSDRDGSSKPSKTLTAAQLRSKESQEYTTSLLKSHASFLTPIISSLSSSLSLSAAEIGIILGGSYLFFHLFAPAFLLPHLSALITLIIPIKNTLLNIAKEEKGLKPVDSPQWSWFWVIYCGFGVVRGWVGIWRPGWKAWLEVIRTGGLICVGGPWFGYAGLNPPGPSEELQKAEKVEQAEEKERKAKEVRDEARRANEKKEKEEKERQKKEKEKKEKEKKEKDKKAKGD